MYRWIAVGCAVGFGLGLIFTSMIFEMALSPYGSPVTIENREEWDWNAQTNTWKFIGIMWILAGLVALYLVYRDQAKAKSSSNPEKDSENTLVEIAREPSDGETFYFKQRETIITIKSFKNLVKVANVLKKPILAYENASNLQKSKPTHTFYVIDNNTKYEYTTTTPPNHKPPHRTRSKPTKNSEKKLLRAHHLSNEISSSTN